jgi:dienelactone hydrolase
MEPVMAYVDYIYSMLSGRIGGLAGMTAALVTMGLAFIAFRMRQVSRGRQVTVILVTGSVLGAGLAAPYVLAASRSRSAPGPFAVQQATLVLPPLAADGAHVPILMEIWFPVKGPAEQTSTLKTCSQVSSLPLAEAGTPRRLLLYIPHFGGPRTDNTARLAYLASYGYVAVAFDDIARDAALPGATPEDEEVRLLTWHVSTPKDFETTLRLYDIRVKRQAEKALDGLDRLAGCAAAHALSPWNVAVDYRHVGFLGYSFGGATAAEAAVMDHRIVAVANLDGTLFGQALAGRLTAPYLHVMSDRPMVTASAMMSKDPNQRYASRIEGRSRHEQAILAAREGSAGIRIRGSVHASLSDAALEPHASEFWLLHNPIAIFNAVNLYTRDFFDTNLRGERATLINQRPSSIPLVERFDEIGMTPDGDFPSPPS